MATTAAITETARIWADYDAWNASVEAEFFDGTWAGRPVYLDMEDDVLTRVADRAGVDRDPREAFKKVLRPTLYLWPEKDGLLLDLHIRRLRRWQLTRPGGPPPCLAVVAFFALAAEGMRSDETFRSNNYYARFCEALGFHPTSNEKAAKKIENDFRRGSLELWDGLNSWLLDHDGALGTPTAFSFDWRSYVGVPISQALLREEERLELRELFVEYRLRPGQQVAASDMLRLLKEWVPKADVSPTLKRLFGQAEAQARIADIASIELQAWDGTVPTGTELAVNPSAAILLAAQVRRLPRPQLNFNLVVRGASPLPQGEYMLEENAAGPAVEALRDTGERVELADPPSDGWRRLESRGPISFPDLLLATVQLLHVGTSAQLVRKPRRLVILERDEEYRIAVEVDRAQLARENVLLAHRSLGDALQSVLEGCAREGFIRWTPEALRGLPADWEAWTAVELVELPDVPDDQSDLSALIPLEWTKVAFGAGLSLPGYSTWLRDAPPEVRVTSFIERQVRASLAQTMSLTGRELAEEELASFDGAAVVTLGSRELEDGDYRVALREAGPRGKPLVSASFRLRSGDLPRLTLDLEGELRYRPSATAPEGSVSAEVVDQRVPPFIAGGVTNPDRELDLHASGPIPPALLEAAPLDPETEADPEDAPVEARSGAVPSCLMGGSHRYQLPEADRAVMLGKRKPSKIDARCMSCGFERWFPPHLRKARPKGAAPKPTVIDAAAPRVAKPDIAAIAEATAPDMDLLLDALTYSGGGGWALFERLAQQVGEEPWFALEAARTLSSLGHIDLVVDLLSGRPTQWAVSPPTLCTTRGGAVLCGARSSRLLERLRQDVEAIGGAIEIDANAAAPATVRVMGIDNADVADIAQSLSASVGFEVHASQGGARAIAAALPTLSELRNALPTLTWPAVSLERFDLRANKWEQAAAIDRGGAYKFVTRPLRYGFVANRDGSGDVVAGDNRLVKWLAAQAEGLNLLAYDAERELLITRLGAQLPGLYERAAVLSSGFAPVRRVDGTVAYREVPADVAATLHDRLGRVPEEGSS
jgi:hypothetical protein